MGAEPLTIDAWRAFYAALSAGERAAMQALIARHRTRSYRLLYAPFRPHAKQEVFLGLTCLEAFYGGAAGPGKSSALLLAALQYADVPGYAALLLRRTYADLALPGALMDVSKEWLGPTDARWSQGDHTWTFPSGATVTFGHLEHEETKRRYAGAEFQFVGFDELTAFSETMYTFLFSRLRRPSSARSGLSPSGLGLDDVPLRMRSASNPGDRGHEWVKARFVDASSREPGVVFIPARLDENPGLDRAAYLEALAELTEVERERLVEGDWDAVEEGGMFRPDEWPIVDRFDGAQAVRVWDFAAAEPTARNPDPDWTVGMRFERDAKSGQCCITDVVRGRWAPHVTEAMVAQAADDDGREVPVVIHQDPGSAGVAVVSRYSRHVLRGKTSVHAVRETGDKATRARPVAAAAGRGEVAVLRRPWLKAFMSELRRFPAGSHDDQVDTLSTAYDRVGRLNVRGTATVAPGRLPSAADYQRRTTG